MLAAACTVYTDGGVLVSHDTFAGRWHGRAATTAGDCGDFTIQLVTFGSLFYQATLIDDAGRPHTVAGSTQADGEIDGRAAPGYEPAGVLTVAPAGEGRLERTGDTISGTWRGAFHDATCEGTVQLTRLK